MVKLFLQYRDQSSVRRPSGTLITYSKDTTSKYLSNIFSFLKAAESILRHLLTLYFGSKKQSCSDHFVAELLLFSKKKKKEKKRNP